MGPSSEIQTVAGCGGCAGVEAQIGERFDGSRSPMDDAFRGSWLAFTVAFATPSRDLRRRGDSILSDGRPVGMSAKTVLACFTESQVGLWPSSPGCRCPQTLQKAFRDSTFTKLAWAIQTRLSRTRWMLFCEVFRDEAPRRALQCKLHQQYERPSFRRLLIGDTSQGWSETGGADCTSVELKRTILFNEV